MSYLLYDGQKVQGWEQYWARSDGRGCEGYSIKLSEDNHILQLNDNWSREHNKIELSTKDLL